MNEISKLSFHSEAREKMIAGVKQLAAAVSITLGPKGKNVAIIRKGQKPHLTKDGVSVANAINLPDPFENLGCQIVKEAAQRTADVAGDGTTTSTVLANGLLISGHRLLEAGYDARQVVRGYEQACVDVLNELSYSRIQLTEPEQLQSIATISANGEEGLGKIVAAAIDRVGADGPIAVENAKGFDTQLDIVDGTVIDQGFLSPYFATNQSKGICELEKCLILIYNQTVSNLHSILPALEIAATSNRSLLVIANDYSTEALQALVMNKMKGAIRICAIRAPEFGNARSVSMEDLAIVCGAKVFGVDSATLAKEEISEEDLGYADKVVVDKAGTVLVSTNGNSELKQSRIDAVIEQMNQPGLNPLELGVLQRRRRRMSDGIAVIRVGGATEADMIERRDRVDDALCASRAAKLSGIQPGGGVAMARAAKNIAKKKNSFDDPSYQAAYDSFIGSCYEPLRQIILNAGESADIVLQKILKSKESNYGYDASNLAYGDMIAMKIIDPHDVVAACLKHATSVACNILLIGCAVSQESEEIQDLGIIDNL